MKGGPGSRYLTIPEIADALGTSDSHAYNLVGQIPGSFKIGSRWRVTREDVDRYIEARKAEQDEKRGAGDRWAAGAEARRRPSRTPMAPPAGAERADEFTIRPVPSRQSLNRERAARKGT